MIEGVEGLLELGREAVLEPLTAAADGLLLIFGIHQGPGFGGHVVHDVAQRDEEGGTEGGELVGRDEAAGVDEPLLLFLQRLFVVGAQLDEHVGLDAGHGLVCRDGVAVFIDAAKAGEPHGVVLVPELPRGFAHALGLGELGVGGAEIGGERGRGEG